MKPNRGGQPLSVSQDLLLYVLHLRFHSGLPRQAHCTSFTPQSYYLRPERQGQAVPVCLKKFLTLRSVAAKLFKLKTLPHQSARRHFGGSVKLKTMNLMLKPSISTTMRLQFGTGKSFHSGYPENGDNAIERFIDFASALRDKEFPVDPILGKTSFNIGKLASDNPQNIISDKVCCRVYFRTTFCSDSAVSDFMASLASEHIKIEELGGDSPMTCISC